MESDKYLKWNDVHLEIYMILITAQGVHLLCFVRNLLDLLSLRSKFSSGIEVPSKFIFIFHSSFELI